MNTSTIASRYADALFGWAEENNQVVLIGEELQVVLALVQEPGLNLLTYLADPAIPQDKKLSLVFDAFASVQAPLRNALALLVEHQRMESLPEVVQHYQQCLDVSQRRLRGTLTTASAVSPKAMEAVTQAIKKRLGADEVLLDSLVDVSILGGASLQVGDFRLDGSFASQLQSLRVG